MTSRRVRSVSLAVLSMAIVAYAILVLLTLNTRHAYQYADVTDKRDNVMVALRSEKCRTVDGGPVIPNSDPRFAHYGTALLLDSRRTLILGKGVLEHPLCIGAVVSELARSGIPTYVVIRDFATAQNSIVVSNE